VNLLVPDVLRSVVVSAFLGPCDLRTARRHHGVVSGLTDE
jgi:exosome complex RNA-binding protein Csl4